MNLKCIQSTIGIAVKTARSASIEGIVKTLESILGETKNIKIKSNHYDAGRKTTVV